MTESRTSEDPAPLIASLKEEAERAGVFVDWEDRKFLEKITRLARTVSREYDIMLSWRAFLEDPNHVKPFFFPERFDKYRKGTPVQTSATPSVESICVTCPVCESLYVRGRAAGCPYCEEHPKGVPTDTIPIWRRVNARISA